MSLFPAKNDTGKKSGYEKAKAARESLGSPAADAATDDEYLSDPINLADIPF